MSDRHTLTLAAARAVGALGALSLALVVTSGCYDPIAADNIDELGGEQSGFGRGPHHRVGQPCLRCHSDVGGVAFSMSMAGTVFGELTQEHPTPEPVEGIAVRLLDSEGNIATVVSNRCGNFYLTPGQFDPAYPVRAELWGNSGMVRPMSSRIGRDGACGECHIHPTSPYSPGIVFVPDALLGSAGGRRALPGECPEPRFAVSP